MLQRLLSYFHNTLSVCNLFTAVEVAALASFRHTGWDSVARRLSVGDRRPAGTAGVLGPLGSFVTFVSLRFPKLRS